MKFADRITLVRGDSATGKTYLYQMLEDLRMTKEYQAAYCQPPLLIPNHLLTAQNAPHKPVIREM